jgi:hypothetical protein
MHWRIRPSEHQRSWVRKTHRVDDDSSMFIALGQGMSAREIHELSVTTREQSARVRPATEHLYRTI